MQYREGVKPDEGVLMIQELEDRLKEQSDKLDHVRLCVAELRDGMAGSNSDLKQSISDHLEWMNHLTERMETLQMNTAVFVQMNTKPRTWRAKQGPQRSVPWARPPAVCDAHSEFGWPAMRTRRNSDAVSEMSCAW